MLFLYTDYRLLCIIPANFLFTNNSMESMTNKDLKTASGCIKHILKMVSYSDNLYEVIYLAFFCMHVTELEK